MQPNDSNFDEKQQFLTENLKRKFLYIGKNKLGNGKT